MIQIKDKFQNYRENLGLERKRERVNFFRNSVEETLNAALSLITIKHYKLRKKVQFAVLFIRSYFMRLKRNIYEKQVEWLLVISSLTNVCGVLSES